MVFMYLTPLPFFWPPFLVCHPLSTEETLTERARTAEALTRNAEAVRAQLAEKVEELTSKASALEVNLSTTTSKLHEAVAQLKTLETLEGEAKEKVSMLESELQEAREMGKRLSKDGKANEAKLKLQLQDAKDALMVVKGDFEHEKSRWQSDMESLQHELTMAKEEGAMMASIIGSSRRSSTSSIPGAMKQQQHHHEILSQSSILERTIAGSLHGGVESPSSRSHLSSSGPAQGSVANGGDGVSILALEKLQQALRQKEEEVIHLQERLQDVERTRDALTQEITVLGKKTSLLQGSLHAAKVLKTQVTELTQKNDVLLELLGEKTEELESLQDEISEVKSRFRKQLDELLLLQQHQPTPAVTLVS